MLLLSRVLRVGLWSLSICLSFAGISIATTFEGDIELLRLAGEMQQANEQSIETWKGTVTHRRTRTGVTNKPYDAYEDSREIEFAFDRSLAAKRWRVNFVECHAYKNSVEMKGVGMGKHFSAGLLKGSDIFTLGPTEEAEANRPYVWQLRENTSPDMRFYGEAPYVFDPFDYLEKSHPNVGLLEQYKGFKRRSEDPAEAQQEGYHISVRREGNLVFLEHSLQRPGGGWFSTRVYDMSRGGYLVNCKQENQATGWSAEHTYEYVLINGAWVPSRRTTTEIDVSGAEPGRTEDWIEVANLVVNEPLEEGEFSLQAVGARKGDLVHDYRTGTEFIYGEDALAASSSVENSGDMSLILNGLDQQPPESDLRSTVGATDSAGSSPVQTQAQSVRPIDSVAILFFCIATAGAVSGFMAWLVLRQRQRRRK